MNDSLHSSRGQAIVLMALLMVGLLAFAALAIDGGNTYVERRRAQNAADAGALAGARELWLHVSTLDSSETTVQQAINEAAESNGIADTNGIAGDTVNDNVTAYYTDRLGNKLGVEVGVAGIPPNAGGINVVTQRDFNTFLAGLIGRGEMGANAEATAVIIPPQGCGDYAIFAACETCGPNNLATTGSTMIINGGGLYSGGDMHLNNTVVINGTVYSVGSCSPEAQCAATGAPVINGGQVQTQPIWEIDDFRPGGPIARALGGNYHYINGNLNALSSGDGLYFVTGSVQINGAGPANVTIVSLGEQKYNGTVNLTAYYHNLLFFSDSSNTSQGAIQIAASDSVWQGLIYAPNGDVNFSAARNLGVSGAIFARSVSASGSQLNINYDPAVCPPSRARVILLK